MHCKIYQNCKCFEINENLKNINPSSIIKEYLKLIHKEITSKKLNQLKI